MSRGRPITTLVPPCAYAERSFATRNGLCASLATSTAAPVAVEAPSSSAGDPNDDAGTSPWRPRLASRTKRGSRTKRALGLRARTRSGSRWGAHGPLRQASRLRNVVCLSAPLLGSDLLRWAVGTLPRAVSTTSELDPPSADFAERLLRAALLCAPRSRAAQKLAPERAFSLLTARHGFHREPRSARTESRGRRRRGGRRRRRRRRRRRGALLGAKRP